MHSTAVPVATGDHHGEGGTTPVPRPGGWAGGHPLRPAPPAAGCLTRQRWPLPATLDSLPAHRGARQRLACLRDTVPLLRETPRLAVGKVLLG